MAVPRETLWDIEPHTQAKHQILQKYLEAWFPIITSYQGRVIFIDGFSGPGRYTGGEVGSPIIALNVARNHRSKLMGEIIFWFIDEREDRISHLDTELEDIDIPDNFKTRTSCGQFCDELGELLDILESGEKHIAPTFAFVDPFGFSGLPFALIRRLLENPSCEVFINFMVESINRWISHPDENIVQHIIETFGTEECLEIIHGPGDRIAGLRNLYQRQLKSVAGFVRFFEMRDEKNKPIYDLFFATNHPIGHVRMKDAMWKVDPDGRFTFSDATDQNQVQLFDEVNLEPLSRDLGSIFKGKTKVLGETVRTYIEDETAYIKRHMTQILRQMEVDGKISVKTTKVDGKKRRANSYPDGVLINFHNK